MELGGIEVILVQSRTEWLHIGGCCYGIVAQRGIIAMDEIGEIAILQTIEQWRLEIADIVPTHSGHFLVVLLGLKFLYVYREYTKTIGIILV